jgi:glycosyltransferase involved in cell wall biosynthesis
MNDSLPFVTVLMPIRNESDFIELSLGSVFAQDYPGNQMEVIVIDGMSTDGTRQIVEHVIHRQDGRLRGMPIPKLTVLENPSKTVPTAMNLGIARARGTVIIRVDGHCEIPADYVSRCVEALNETDADCVGGPLLTCGESAAGKAIAAAQSSSFGVGGALFRTGTKVSREVDTLAFGAYRRAVFERIGLFDEELTRNQDDEFNYRLRSRGGRILLSPRIQSLYYSRATIPSLCRQYFQYGFWKVRVAQKHPAQMRIRHFLPAILVTILVVGALIGFFSMTVVRLWLVAVAVYGIANAAASLWTSRSSGWATLPLLPIAFASLHLSYGLGFLTGLIRFWNRWRDTHTRASIYQPVFQSRATSGERL